MVKGFEHVGIACSNIDKSLEFYRDLLGLKVLQYEKTPDGTTVALLDAGGGGLELFGSATIRDTPAPQVPERSAGIRHFGFTVTDLQKTFDLLRYRGVEFPVLPRKPKVMKNATMLAFCKDPDGLLIELVERKG